jgi:error-prone DNA polymerase
MGFYSSATLVKDAQRHGLKVKPIDVLVSSAECTLEPLPSPSNEKFAMRLGFNFVKSLRSGIADGIIAQRQIRPFTSIDDFSHRLPGMQKSELTALAEIGALNSICGERGHRRTALWQVERAARPAGPLFDSDGEEFPGNATFADSSGILAGAESLLGVRSFSSDITPTLAKEALAPKENSPSSPLSPMSPEERLVADFRGTGLTVGIHPMAHHRATLCRQGVRTAIDLRSLPDGTPIRIAGTVITRQRPGTAKGFVFLSMEDETGIANAIITPQLFAQNRVVIVHERFLLIDGVLQNQDNVISVKAHRIQPLTLTRAAAPSHDFH